MDDDNICDLLGFNIEQKALEIVKNDLSKKGGNSPTKKNNNIKITKKGTKIMIFSPKK
jgi:predicted transcriptional regulator